MKKINRILTVIGAFGVVGVVACAAHLDAVSSGSPSAPTPRPASKVVAAVYPPTTLAAFRAFAATGDAAKVHQIARSSEGLPSCPEPNIDVTVGRALTGRALQADLSAFFVQSGLINDHCQAFVFAFHSRRDYRLNSDNGYTVGQVALTTNSGSGGRYNLEVDAGNITTTSGIFNQTQFNFNF